MAVALVGLGAFLVSLPALCRRGGRHLRPSEWSRLAAGGLIVGATVVEVGLALLAAPTVLRWLGVEALAAACGRVVGPLLPFGDAGGWIAAAGLAVTVGLGVGALRASRAAASSAWIEPEIGIHRLKDGADIVVVPTDRLLAYSVVAPTPQIVVSEGLISRCRPDELDVIVAHERAHLTYRHQRLLALAAAAKAALIWWPPTARTHRVVCASLERWADETAAGDEQDRRRCLSSVLERVATEPSPAAVTALSTAALTAERIDALAEPVSASHVMHRMLYIPGAVVGVASLFAFAVWLSQAQLVLALAGRCPLSS